MFIRNAWYVAAGLSEFGSHDYSVDAVSAKPLPRTVLGEPLVMVPFADGEIAVFEDACPHRRAPLSLGTIEGGGLRCAYHGLKFDADGTCIHAPNDAKPPALATVRRYPSVQRYGWLWVWMGAAGLADEDKIPQIIAPYFDGTYRHVYGYHHLEAYYELIIDNLLDLSHVDVIHAGVLGTTFMRKAQVETKVEAETVSSTRFCAGQEVPPIFAPMFPGKQNVDFWADMKWQPPASYSLEVAVALPDSKREEAIHIVNLDLITPETETSSHYFWTHGRQFETDNPMLDASIHHVVDVAFDQDQRIIEGQQSRLPNGDIRGMRLAACKEDMAGMRARTIVEKLYKEESHE